MNKQQIESLVRQILHFPIDLTDEGKDRWESVWMPTTIENTGIFYSVFNHIQFSVLAQTPHPDTPAYFPINIKITWHYRDGGQNGARIDRYWHEPTNELLTFEQARQRNMKGD
jgi:hypothetical protein